MTRKKLPPPVVFKIVWDADNRHWKIQREGELTGQFSFSKATAISMATQQAMREAEEGHRVAVRSLNDGRTITDFSS